MKVKLELPSADELIKRLGVDPQGEVQTHFTGEVLKRIGKYMPHLTGVLETKKTHIKNDTEIETLGPYAQYLFHGVTMEGRVPMKATSKPLNYTKTFNPMAGPFWDRSLVANEGAAITANLQEFIDGGGK